MTMHRDELEKALKKAVAAFEALPPEQQREHRAAQRRSWVKGELMMAHPELTEAQADALIAKAEVRGWVSPAMLEE